MKDNLSSIKNLENICTGCYACEHLCPVKCISLKKDREGFVYPIVNQKQCVHCGLCVENCHMLLKHDENKSDYMKGFYAWAPNEIRDMSSSGGAFSMIVDAISSENGYIVGAAFSEDWFNVYHKICQKDDYSPLRKSKYVFSDLNTVFPRIKELLCSGNDVIFCGTPCQVSGLKQYLGEDYPHLFLIDFICHGVSSPEFYEKHIKYLIKDNNIRLVDFRPSGCGWDPALKIVLEDDTTIFRDQTHDFYLYNYFHNYSLRKCCYSCKYAVNNHQADITLADFWRAGQVDKNLLNEPGVSLVICNTEKGIDAWSKVGAAKSEILDYSLFAYVYNNNHNWYNLDMRNDFFTRLDKTGIEKAEMKFSRKCKHFDRIQGLKKIIKKIIRR